MAAKKSKSAMLASNATRAGSSSSGPTGKVTPNTNATQANTQQFTNKSKRKSKKGKKPNAGSDADPGNASGNRAENPKEATKVDPKKDSKHGPKSKDAHGESKKVVPTEKNAEKSIRSEPFIVNGMDRRSKESQMSGSQINSHANNTTNARDHSAALPNNFGS